MNITDDEIKLFTAIVGFFAALVTLVAVVRRELKPAKQALDLLTKTYERPLQGIWTFIIDYDRFQNRAGSWRADGKAVIFWKRAESRYEIFAGDEIKNLENDQKELVGAFHGIIDADEHGIPQELFRISSVEYIARMTIPGIGEPSTRNYEYSNCKLKRRGDRITSISGEFSTLKSSGKVKLELKYTL